MYKWFLVYKFFDKETGSGSIATNKAGANVNKVLAQELHKPLIKKIKRRQFMQSLKINFGLHI